MAEKHTTSDEILHLAMATGPLPWINRSWARRWVFRGIATTFVLLPAIRARDTTSMFIAFGAVLFFGVLEFNLGFLTHALLHLDDVPDGKPTFIIKQLTLRGGDTPHDKTTTKRATDDGGNKRSSASSRRKRQSGA